MTESQMMTRVLSEEGIGEETAEEGGEVNCGDEDVEFFNRLGLGHRFAGMCAEEVQVLRHEDDEDPAHAVERESFRCFVADDVWDAGGHSFDTRIR